MTIIINRRALLRGGAGLVAAPVLSQVPAGEALAAGGISREDFTIVVLPDTQHAVKFFPNALRSQINWILANKTSSWRVRYVAHVGDIVHNPDQSAQWAFAREQLTRLDGVMPLAIAPGNHDCPGSDEDSRGSTATFNAYFPYSKFNALQNAGASYPAERSDNTWHQFTAGGTDWGIICLAYSPTDADRAWANTVVAANPWRQFIVVTHGYMRASDGARILPYGETMWQTFVRNHPNVFMVLCGHSFSGAPRYVADTGVYGNQVHQVLADYQHAKCTETHQYTCERRNSWFRIMKFRPSLARIEVTTYSFLSPSAYRDVAGHVDQFHIGGIAFPTRAPQVRRHILNSTVLAQWRLTGNDIWPIVPAEAAKLPGGTAISGPPDVIYSSGIPGLFINDNGYKRHIINPRSLAAWRLTAVTRRAISNAQFEAMPTGPAWPAYPHLIRADGQTAVFLLDSPL